MIIILQSVCPSSSRFYDGCLVPAILDAMDTCLSFVNISGTLLSSNVTATRPYGK